jgi:acetoacetyl-CoA synthetase
MNQPIWTPSKTRINTANMTRFMTFIQDKYHVNAHTFEELYQWSIKDLENFWQSIAEFCDVHFTKQATTILSHADQMEKAVFFGDAQLNYAENLLRRRDDADGIVFWGETKIKRKLSFKELYDQVSQMAAYFKDLGLQPGDRVAGFVPNAPETIVCMLAATSLGAVWTSCSPDFGVSAVIDRFGQVEPTILIAADKYIYRTTEHSCLEKISEIQALLPSLKKTIVFSYDGQKINIQETDKIVSCEAILERYAPKEIVFTPMGFNDPLFIMYSSGTTGIPKCIVHGIGGTLLQHMKEHQLHCDIKPNDRIFYFSTCGWMMWNWQVTALASKAMLLIYDGCPICPNEEVLFDFMAQEKMTFFGIAAKIIDAFKKRNVCPKKSHDLSHLRDIASTGSPLVQESFDYIYESIKEDVSVMSIAGGTDIISCFVLGNPIAPVWRGEIQTAGLGMSVQVFDDEGHAIKEKKGELVCTKPFPSMPIYFWNDPERAKYHETYFEEYDNVWCHGDFAEITANNGFVIYGRSDTILNPGGVRIGTAEIYRQVEKVDAVLESIVIGQAVKDDVRVILFVKLKENTTLTDELKTHIKTTIRTHTTPRHVPALILAVRDIPRTKSGKLVELAVKNIIEGRLVKNKDALANPEALQYFENLVELLLT